MSYEMGQAAILAAQNTKKQLLAAGYQNTTICLTPMIGLNDTSGQVFTLADAVAVLNFANANSYISMLSFWSANRDVAQTVVGTTAANNTSGIIQTQNQFMTIFKQFMSPTPTPTPVPKPVPTPTPTPVPKPVPTPTPKFYVSFVFDSGVISNVQVTKG